MRFVILAASLFVACAVSAGIASGSNGAATPFKASYTDSALGALATCSGAHVVQGNGTVKDSETCILSGDTSLVVPGTVTGHPGYCLGNVCGWVWGSDFDGHAAADVTIHFVDNGDGTFTENVVAYY